MVYSNIKDISRLFSANLIKEKKEKCEGRVIYYSAESTSSISFSQDGLYILLTQKIDSKRGRVRIIDTLYWNSKCIDFDHYCRNVVWLGNTHSFFVTLENGKNIRFVRLTDGFPSLSNYH